MKKIHLKNCSSGKYRYYALAESKKIKGKNQKQIIKYLGALTPEQVYSYKLLLKNINEGTGSFVDVEELIFKDQKNFLDVAVLHCLWNHLGLNTAFHTLEEQHRKHLITAQVAEILTLSKLLSPSSNIGTIKWFQTNYLSELMGIDQKKYNRMKIFNELNSIASQKESIEKRLLKIARAQNKDEFEIYFIDGTTTYFEGSHCELGKKGKDKTTGYQPHMILIMLITDRSGFPCVWDVCRGNEKEVSHFKKIAKRVYEKYQITHTTFCFDRGFASAENFKTVDAFLSRFISGIDKNQIFNIFNIKQFQKTREQILDHAQSSKQESKKRDFPIDGFFTSDRKCYFKELGTQGKYRYIAGFNTEIFHSERQNREQAQQNTFLELEKLNEKYKKSKKTVDLDVVAKTIDKLLEKQKMQKLISYKIIPCTVRHKKKCIQSCTIEYALNMPAWDKAGALDGLFVYITNHIKKNAQGLYQVGAYDVIRHYRDKWVIERNFRDLKSILNIRPIYVYLPEHVRALVSISIIVQFINVFLAKKLETIDMSLSDFYFLLERSSAVATLSTPTRTLKKLIQTHPKLIRALEAIGLKDLVFSSKTMAVLK